MQINPNSEVNSSKKAWHAHLRLGFSDDVGITRLTERTHCGPLRVQKPLYPEGGQVCHAIIVHPPGGVVGGDQLHIAVQAHDSSRVVITTPGAAKWYKANGETSQQNIQIDVGAKASVEWLPQETIFFDTAHVKLVQSVSLAMDASYLACDILCFGRSASGERFHTGKISQNIKIRRAGQLIWHEQGSFTGGSQAMNTVLGLADHTVCASLIAVSKAGPAAFSAAQLTALRDEAQALLELAGVADVSQFGVTQIKTVIVVRFLGDASEIARQVMLLAWRHLRPVVIGRDAIELRIWNT